MLMLSVCYDLQYIKFHTSTPLFRPQVAHTPVAPVGSPVGSSLSLIPEDGLPPILISTGVKGGTGGHITGACPHPHHSAASSLFCQLLCLCSSRCYMCFISRLMLRALIANSGVRVVHLKAAMLWIILGLLAVVNLDSEHHATLLPHLLWIKISLLSLHHVQQSPFPSSPLPRVPLSSLSPVCLSNFISTPPFFTRLSFCCSTLTHLQTMLWRRGRRRLFSCSSWRKEVQTRWSLCSMLTCSPWSSLSTVSYHNTIKNTDLGALKCLVSMQNC